MKKFFKNVLSSLGYEISAIHPIDAQARKAWRRYANYTMVPEELFIENLKLVWNFRDVHGCVVECGVWRGGMSAGMADILPQKEFFLFDSFEGLPEAKAVDGKKALAWQRNITGPTYYDNCTAGIEFATTALEKSGVKFHIIKGWFSETLPKVKFSKPISILRLDSDWYESTMDCLKNLYPFVAAGGLIILDDYHTWDGCAQAVHQYLADNALPARIHKTPLGVPYLIKRQ